MDFLKKISPGLLGWLTGLVLPFVTLFLLIEYMVDGNALDTIPVLYAYDDLGIWITIARVFKCMLEVLPVEYASSRAQYDPLATKIQCVCLVAKERGS